MFTKSPLGLPKLRFKGFDGEWEEKKFKNILKIFDGPHATPNYYQHGFPFYSVEYITSNKHGFIDQEQYEKFQKTYKPVVNDILFTRIGIIGKSKIITVNDRLDFSIYVSISAIRIISKDIALFFQYAIQTHKFKKQLLLHSLTTAVPIKINIIDLYKLKINFPSLQEQTKIATFFSLLDKQIELWEKKLQLVELIFKWYKNILFTKITKSNKLPFLCLFKEYVVKNYNNHPQYTIGKFGIQKVKNINYKIDNHKVFYNNSIILGLGIEEIIYNKNIIGSCSPIYKTFKLSDEYKHLENYFYFFIKKYFYSIKHTISKKSTRRDWEFDNKLLKELKIPLPNNMENKFIKKLLIIEKNINNLLLKKSNLNLKKSFYIDSILI